MPRGIPSRAINNPVNAPTKEFYTGDIDVGQNAPIDLSNINHEQIIVPLDTSKEYMTDLAFFEEPITIRIAGMGGKNAPNSVDCWVQGKGAEIQMNGKWQALGFFPVGIPVTTKRKYVEVLARCKVESIDANSKRYEDREEHLIGRTNSHNAPFSVIKDANPHGAEWLTRLMMEV